MPKAQVFNEALQALKNKIPKGMFSTLDELIAAHPSGKATAEEWKNYLKPGQTLTREGVSFPLKQEELDYTGLSDFFKNLDERSNGAMIEGPNLQNMAQRQRPGFDVGDPQDFTPGAEAPTNSHFRAYSHDSAPGSLKQYDESLTESPNFGTFKTHFSPETLSWSRTTGHQLPEGGALRLIDEIQSDRHAAAAEKIMTPHRIDELQEIQGSLDQGNTLHGQDRLFYNRYNGVSPNARVGYQDPAKMSELEGRLTEAADSENDLNADYHNLRIQRNKPPDAPFKGAADYGSLEMKKQLLNAVNSNQDYLGLVRGSDQISRYPGLNPDQQKGMQYGYDKVYHGALEKLGRQYGAPMTDVQTQIPNSVLRPGSTRPPSFDRAGAADLPDFLSTAEEMNEGEDFHPMISGLLDDYHTHMGHRPDVAEQINDAKTIHQALQELPLTEATDDSRIQLQNHLYDHLMGLQGTWNEGGSSIDPNMPKKTFPAIHLTPEVREKVKKAGVPIWAAAGTATGLDVLKDQLDSDEDASRPNDPDMQFAEGGEVSSLAKLRGYLDDVPGEDANSDAQYLRGPANMAYTLGDDGKPKIGMHPGVIDQALAIPSDVHLSGPIGRFVSMVMGQKSHLSRDPGYASALKKMGDTVSGISNHAADRQEKLDEATKKELGVEDPTTAIGHFAHAAGELSSMIPVGNATSTTGKAIKSLLETVGPAITPKLSHYLGIGALQLGAEDVPDLLKNVPVAHSNSPPANSDAPTTNMMADAGYSRGGNVQEKMMNGRNMNCGGLMYATGGRVIGGVQGIDGTIGGLLAASRAQGSPVAGTQQVATPVTPASMPTSAMAGQMITLPGGQTIMLPGSNSGSTTVGGTPATGSVSTGSGLGSGALGGNQPNGQNLLTNNPVTSSSGAGNVTAVGAQDIANGSDIYDKARERLARLFHTPYANPKGYSDGGPVDARASNAVKQVYQQVKSGQTELAAGISDLMGQLNIDQNQARAALQALSSAGY